MLTEKDLDVIHAIMHSKGDVNNNDIDSLILKTQKPTQFERLYRGVCNTERRKLLDLEVGSILELNRPTSFTTSIYCAEHFSSEVYHTGIVIELHCENSVCMNYYQHAVDYISGLDEEFFLDNKSPEANSRLDYYVMLADETEQIFHSETKYKLIEIESDKNAYGEDIKIYHFIVDNQ